MQNKDMQNYKQTWRPGFKQVYGPRTGWTFPPNAPENYSAKLPHDAVEGPNIGDLIVLEQRGSSRWVRVRK